MLRRFMRDIGAYGRFTVWVFLALIGGFMLLNWISGRFGGGPVGGAAVRVEALARGNTVRMP